MRRVVVFDEFAFQCQYFCSETDANNGYGCNHEEQRETVEINGKEKGCCFCHTCPLGIEAEQEDLTDTEHPDAIKEEIDWDGLCEDGEVTEGEYLLVDVDETAREDVKKALYEYDVYMNRYNKEWLDEHGIANGLVE